MSDPSDNKLARDITTSIPIGQQAIYGEIDAGARTIGIIGPNNPMFNHEFGLATARGLIPGHATFEKFGIIPNILMASVPEDIWNGGGEYTGFPTGVVETIDVLSSDAADTLAGTGLRSIRLFGQLAGIEQTEDVNLNGVTPVTTTKQWDRMGRIRGLTVGSNKFNAGLITARHTTTVSNVFAIMPIGTNRTQIAAGTVPANKTLFLKSFDPRFILSGGAQATGSIAIMCRELGTDFQTFEQTHTLNVTTRDSEPLETGFAVKLPARTDFVARIVEVSANNTSATAQFFGIMVDD